MTEFELEARDQEQLERDYKDWCAKYDINYIVVSEDEINEDNS